MPILAKIGNYRIQQKEHLEQMNRNRIPKRRLKGKGTEEKREKEWIEAGRDLQTSTMMDMTIMIVKK